MCFLECGKDGWHPRTFPPVCLPALFHQGPQRVGESPRSRLESWPRRTDTQRHIDDNRRVPMLVVERNVTGERLEVMRGDRRTKERVSGYIRGVETPEGRGVVRTSSVSIAKAYMSLSAVARPCSRPVCVGCKSSGAIHRVEPCAVVDVVIILAVRASCVTAARPKSHKHACSLSSTSTLP